MKSRQWRNIIFPIERKSDKVLFNRECESVTEGDTLAFYHFFKIKVGSRGSLAQTPPLLGQRPKFDTFFFYDSP